MIQIILSSWKIGGNKVYFIGFNSLISIVSDMVISYEFIKFITKLSQE